jgi:RNA polymerase sigma-70 factor (ECF subfamily)
MARIDYSGVSDADLLARTVNDPEAFGVFYDRFEAPVLAFFRRALGQADLAADLTAEVFANALSSAIAFEPRLATSRGESRGVSRAVPSGLIDKIPACGWVLGRSEEDVC